MSGQRGLGLLGREIPDACEPVGFPGHETLSVRAVRERVDRRAGRPDERRRGLLADRPLAHVVAECERQVPAVRPRYEGERRHVAPRMECERSDRLRAADDADVDEAPAGRREAGPLVGERGRVDDVRGAHDLAEAGVPDADGLVVASADEVSSVAREREPVDTAGVASELEHRLLCLPVEDPDGVVRVADRHEASVGAEPSVLRYSAGAREDVQAARLVRPDDHRAVDARARDHPAVVAERERVERHLMCLRGRTERLPAGAVPDLDAAVGIARREDVAGRVGRDLVDRLPVRRPLRPDLAMRLRVPLEDSAAANREQVPTAGVRETRDLRRVRELDAVLRLQIPDARARVVAPSRQEAAVRAERDRVDRTGVGDERVHRRPAVALPDLGGEVLVGGRDVFAVRAGGDGVHRAGADRDDLANARFRHDAEERVLRSLGGLDVQRPQRLVDALRRIDGEVRDRLVREAA